MRKRKATFEELVRKNKEELMHDKSILDKVEERLFEKHATEQQ